MSGETLSDSAELTVLQNVCQKAARAHLRLGARRLMCAQPVKENVLAYMNAEQASANAGEPIELGGAQGKAYGGKGVGKGQTRWADERHWRA